MGTEDVDIGLARFGMFKFQFYISKYRKPLVWSNEKELRVMYS